MRPVLLLLLVSVAYATPTCANPLSSFSWASNPNYLCRLPATPLTLSTSINFNGATIIFGTSTLSYSGTATFTNVNFVNGTTRAIESDTASGVLTISNAVIHGFSINSVPGNQAGFLIYVYDQVIFNNVEIYDVKTYGALWSSVIFASGNSQVTNSYLHNLTSTDLVVNFAALFYAFNSSFVGLNGGRGPLFGGQQTIDQCTFLNCRSGEEGGAIRTDNNLLVSNSYFADNSAVSYGGAIYVGISGTIRNSTFVRNSAPNPGTNGGAIAGSLGLIENCVFSEGYAYYGPAIAGNLAQVKNCTFLANQAVFGGTVRLSSNSNIDCCYFDGNLAPGQDGAAISVEYSGSGSIVSVTNSAFLNSADNLFSTDSSSDASFQIQVQGSYFQNVPAQLYPGRCTYVSVTGSVPALPTCLSRFTPSPVTSTFPSSTTLPTSNPVTSTLPPATSNVPSSAPSSVSSAVPAPSPSAGGLNQSAPTSALGSFTLNASASSLASPVPTPTPSASAAPTPSQPVTPSSPTPSYLPTRTASPTPTPAQAPTPSPTPTPANSAPQASDSTAPQQTSASTVASSSAGVLRLSNYSWALGLNLNGPLSLTGGYVTLPANLEIQLNVAGSAELSGILLVDVSQLDTSQDVSVPLLSATSILGSFDSIQLIGTPSGCTSDGSLSYTNQFTSLVLQLNVDCGSSQAVRLTWM